MSLIENLRIECSRGATVLSRRPTVRFEGDISDLARVAGGWDAARQRLMQAIGEVGRDDRPGGADRDLAAPLRGLDASIARERPAEALSRLIAATAASLLESARAPRLVWGQLSGSTDRFFAYWDDWMYGAGRAAADGLPELLEAAFAPGAADLAEAAARAVGRVRAARVEGFVYPIVRAAEDRDIPWRMLNARDMVVAYGQGARQCWIRATMSEAQSYASVYITLRKDLTSKLLARAGLPVPDYRHVSSRAEAEAAARELGPPLVVKPFAGTRAEGVSLNLQTPEDVGRAYLACGAEGDNVMVERYIEGEPYRITVFGGRAIAAGRHSLPAVIGDGRATVAELMEAWDARATPPVADPYARFYTIDRAFYAEQIEARLEAQGLTPESVPDEGREVLLGYLPQRTGGGLYVDVTDRIHPGLMRMAEDAAEVIGTPTAGVDILTTDITRAPGEVPLAINEVNSSPSARAHEQAEQPRQIARSVLAASLPAGVSDGDQARLPIAAFLELADTAVLDRLERLLCAAGRVPGVATADAARIDGFALRPFDGAGSHPGAAVLRDRRPDVAAFAYGLGDLGRRGVPSDHADVAAFPPGVLGSEKPLLRPAARALAGWPGALLLTPAGEDCAWLCDAAPHRRWLAVAGPGCDAQTLARRQEEGAGLVAVEGTSVLLSEGGRRDRLHLGAAPPPEDLIWALAALLGLGFAPGKLLRLSSTREAADAALV